jgi:hypothetical protein
MQDKTVVENMLQTDSAYQGMTKEEFVKTFALRVFKIAGFETAEFPDL